MMDDRIGIAYRIPVVTPKRVIILHLGLFVLLASGLLNQSANQNGRP